MIFIKKTVLSPVNQIRNTNYEMRFTVYDSQFTIYDLRFTIDERRKLLQLSIRIIDKIIIRDKIFPDEIRRSHN